MKAMKYLAIIVLTVIACGTSYESLKRNGSEPSQKLSSKMEANPGPFITPAGTPAPPPTPAPNQRTKPESPVPSEQPILHNSVPGQPTQPTVVAGLMPDLLEIPTIHLKAVVSPVGILENGQMGVPKQFDRVGILDPWTKPGERGNAAIAGHFDHYTGPAVFYDLRKLKQGDQVIVSNKQAKQLTFVVRSVESFTPAEAPLQRIFGKSDKPNLNLITCSGKFNKKRQEHARRLVVFTELQQNP